MARLAREEVFAPDEPSSGDDNRQRSENPYAPPVLSSRTDAPAVEHNSTEELRAIVGPKKADYYLRKWSTVRQGGRGGWNWAAFFLAGFWLAYRRMYKIAFVFLSIICLESLLEQVLFVGVVGLSEPPAVIGHTVGLLVGALCGSHGNGWYLCHAKKVIIEVREERLSRDAHLQTLSERGGTSLTIAFGILALFMATTAILFVVLELTLFPGVMLTD